MAASNKCMWFAFALTFAVVAATLQPSAATRVLDDADQEAAGSSPPRPPVWRPRPLPPLPPLPCIPGLPRLPWMPPCNNGSSSSGGGGGAPVHPHPPLPPLPCIPGLPRLPWMPPCINGSSSSSGSGSGAPIDPPPPAECRTSLSGLAPCAEFLTNATSVSAPAAACCAGVKSLLKDAPICLCHAMSGGDLGKLLPAHVLRLRVMALPRTCHVAVPFGTLRNCIRGPVPPMDAPSAPPAA